MLAALLIPGCAEEAPAPAGEEEATYHWKNACGEVEGDYMFVQAEIFADAMEEWSDGRITIDTYPYGVLGQQYDVVEQCQLGAVEFTMVDPAWYSYIVPQGQVLFLYHLWPREKTSEVLDWVARNGKSTPLLQEKFRDKGLVSMGYGYRGWHTWTSNTRIFQTPEDCKGIKVRVMPSRLLIESHEAFGFDVIELPYGEIYGALQTGLMDGQANPLDCIWGMNFYEVQDYFTQPWATVHITAPLANQEFFDSLPEDISDQVLTEWMDSIAPTVEWYELQIVSVEQKIQEARPEVSFYFLTDEEVAVFKELSLGARDKAWNEEVGGEGYAEIYEALMDDIEAAKEKLGID